MRTEGAECAGRRRSRLPLLTCFSAILAVSILAVLAALAAGCGVSGVGDGGPVSFGTDSAETMGDLHGDSNSNVGSADTTTSSVGTLPVEESATTSTASASADGASSFKIYLVRDDLITPVSRTVPKTRAVGTEAMRSLLKGPTVTEQQAGIFSCLPAGTALLGLSVAEEVASVDLSREFSSGGGSFSMVMRLAQVVFTLTQFPTVQSVQFKLDGEPIAVLGGEGVLVDNPVTRLDYEDMTPAILVESPTWGATVHSPLRVTGTANVFEAVFHLELVDEKGRVVISRVVKAAAGTGTRGTFDVTIPLAAAESGTLNLVLYARSPKDGQPVSRVEMPLYFED